MRGDHARAAAERGPLSGAALRVLLVTVVIAAAGCRPKPAPGHSCKIAGQLVCADKDHALECDSGTWTLVPCKGHHGCARQGHADECDDAVAAEADACPRNPPVDYACTLDHTRALVCSGGRFDLWRACRGPAGCQLTGGRSVDCDTSAGEPGDPCGKDGSYACSVDRAAMLVCRGSALTTSSSCRGPNGCRIDREARQIACDDTVASTGDPCDEPDRITCALDHKAELVCTRSANPEPSEANRQSYAKKRDCKRQGCRLDKSELFCD